jgi:hypothetical protein
MIEPSKALDPDVWSRIWSRVVVNPVTGCWLWSGAKHESGYGRMKIGRKLRPVHRVVYEACFGVSLSRDIFVCHRCDTPPCVNPLHLFPGSALINNRDSVQKNRNAHGEKAGSAKINLAQAKAIAAADGKYEIIAQKFGISLANVRQIKQGVRWKQSISASEIKQNRPGRFAKLTPETVLEIYSSGEKTGALSRRFGVCGTTIRNIKTGICYSDLTKHERFEREAA